MATILTKKSDSSSAVPTAGDLTNSTGGAELAVNTADKRLFVKNSGGTVVELGTNPSTIDINAGTIDGTAIGASTPSTGAFTTLSSTGNTTLGDASTDTVQANGYMGVGGAGNAAMGLRITSNALTGASQYGIVGDPTGTSGATTLISGIWGRAATAAAAYTVTNLVQLHAAGAVKGAGSTITNQHGVYIADQTQGTNNYGITSLVSSGTDKWNIYASGTAQNYFAGKVGIGATTTGTNFLEVRSSSGSGDIASSRDLLVAGENTIGRYLFGARSDASTYVYPSYIASVGAAAWSVSSTPTYMSFYVTSSGTTTPTERLRISPTEAVFNDPGADYDFRVESDTNTHALFVDAGNSRVGVNNSAPAVALDVTGQIRASTGILFGTDTAAANALDDYEEGTFTPTIVGSTTAGTGTYTGQLGTYTKIGNVVYFYVFVGWSAHTGTGDLQVGALPFTAKNTSNQSPVVNLTASSLTFSNQAYATVFLNTTLIGIRSFSSNAATAAVAMDTAATVIVSGFYYV